MGRWKEGTKVLSTEGNKRGKKYGRTERNKKKNGKERLVEERKHWQKEARQKGRKGWQKEVVLNVAAQLIGVYLRFVNKISFTWEKILQINYNTNTH